MPWPRFHHIGRWTAVFSIGGLGKREGNARRSRKGERVGRAGRLPVGEEGGEMVVEGEVRDVVDVRALGARMSRSRIGVERGMMKEGEESGLG